MLTGRALRWIPGRPDGVALRPVSVRQFRRAAVRDSFPPSITPVYSFPDGVPRAAARRARCRHGGSVDSRSRPSRLDGRRFGPQQSTRPRLRSEWRPLHRRSGQGGNGPTVQAAKGPVFRFRSAPPAFIAWCRDRPTRRLPPGSPTSSTWSLTPTATSTSSKSTATACSISPRSAGSRVNTNGSVQTIASEGLVMPGCITIGPDGAIYVSNYSMSPDIGEVMRIQP